MSIKITTSNQVVDRETGKEYGWVDRVDYPVSRNGQMGSEKRWEARRPHELGVVNHFAFPTFATRREAAEYLADR